MRRTHEEARSDKLHAVREADAAGMVADSMEARSGIVQRIMSGEITPDDGKAELARLKRNAKKNGLVTRSQVFRNG